MNIIGVIIMNNFRQILIVGFMRKLVCGVERNNLLA